MDFRNCPSCKASVLEDDVEDCPFCGASMSGKPSSKPAPAKPKPAAAKTSAAGAKPQASSAAAAGRPAAPVAKARPTPEELDDGTDPFEVDTKATINVPAVSPRPVKGRTLRVACPMCETAGFIPPQLQGKDVKCCNPQCLMPVFTVPRPKAAPVEEPPKRSASSLVFLGIAAVVLIGVGTALYQFVLKPESRPRSSILDGAGPRPSAQNGKAPPEIVELPKEPATPPPVPLEEVRSTSLVEVERAAQQRQNNRSKPFGRRMSAEAFADAGDFTQAREQLADMQKVPGYSAYNEVQPLVEISAGLAATGDAAGAAAALDEALAKADLPKYGRDPLDAASTLATALVIAGRLDDAQRIAGLVDDPGERGRAFALWRAAIDSDTLDLDAPAQRPEMNQMPSAVWVSVTNALVARNHGPEALAWAQLATNVAVRDNALAAWAAGLARNAALPAGQLTPAEVTAVLPGLSPAGQARVWAAIAHVHQTQKNDAAAAECLTQAVAALEALPAPAATLPAPSLKTIYDSDGQPRAGLPDPTEAQSAARAAADIAQVRAALGDIPGAWAAMSRGLAYLRGTTPSPTLATQLVDESSQNRANFESELKALLSLSNTQQVFLAANRYQTQCKAIQQEATARWDLQVALLRRVAAAGVLQPLWDEVLARQQHPENAENEPYFDTLLPSTIISAATSAKQAEVVRSVQQDVPKDKQRTDPADRLPVLFRQALDAGKFRDAADILRNFDQQVPDNSTSYIHALYAVSRLLKAGQQDQAVELVVNCTNLLIREDAWQLIAAAAVRDNRHSDLWRRRMELGLAGTELAAFYRGCIRGITLRPASTAEDAKTASQ